GAKEAPAEAGAFLFAGGALSASGRGAAGMDMRFGFQLPFELNLLEITGAELWQSACCYVR
ncbi:MAG TPA: hypothetical protein VIM62_00965, partial [Acidobacteriaceae bacterium]